MNIEAQLRQLQIRYARRLPQRIAVLESCWQAILDRPDAADEPAQTLARELHALAGSGASFGYEPISRQARAVERQLLIQRVETPFLPDRSLREAFDTLLITLREIAAEAAPP